ncbi:hypothetical protein LEMLEM_LOCUS3333, partial [Lemmus lemmus]
TGIFLLFSSHQQFPLLSCIVLCVQEHSLSGWSSWVRKCPGLHTKLWPQAGRSSASARGTSEVLKGTFTSSNEPQAGSHICVTT